MVGVVALPVAHASHRSAGCLRGAERAQHAEALLVAVAEELRLGGQVVDAVEHDGRTGSGPSSRGIKWTSSNNYIQNMKKKVKVLKLLKQDNYGLKY